MKKGVRAHGIRNQQYGLTTVTLNGRIQFKVMTVDVVPNRTIAVLFGYVAT